MFCGSLSGSNRINQKCDKIDMRTTHRADLCEHNDADHAEEKRDEERQEVSVVLIRRWNQLNAVLWVSVVVVASLRLSNSKFSAHNSRHFVCGEFMLMLGVSRRQWTGDMEPNTKHTRV